MTFSPPTPDQIKDYHFDIYQQGWKDFSEKVSASGNPWKGKNQQKAEAWRLGHEAAERQAQREEDSKLYRRMHPHLYPLEIVSIVDFCTIDEERDNYVFDPEAFEKWVEDRFKTPPPGPEHRPFLADIGRKLSV